MKRAKKNPIGNEANRILQVEGRMITPGELLLMDKHQHKCHNLYIHPGQ